MMLLLRKPFRWSSWRRVIACERGATVLEYIFLTTLIGIAAIGAFTAMGGSLDDLYYDLGNKVENAGS